MADATISFVESHDMRHELSYVCFYLLAPHLPRPSIAALRARCASELQEQQDDDQSPKKSTRSPQRPHER